MDATTAGLIGSFGGAVVGGLLAAGASFLTTRYQWGRESESRSLDRMEDAVEEVFALVTIKLRLFEDPAGKDDAVYAFTMEERLRTAALEAKARRLSPHLGETLQVLDGRARSHLQALSEMFDVLLDWWLDPRGYERAKRSVEESVDRVRQHAV